MKKRLSLTERIVKWLGLPVDELEYDLIYGSRRVVKNKFMEDPKQKDHFFGYDLWEKVKDEVKDKIPKGYTLYGEFLGYDHNGGVVQKGYDYGCEEGEHKLEVYRITQTSPEGLVTELSYPEMEEFCERYKLNLTTLMYYGRADNWLEVFSEDLTVPFKDNFIKTLEKEYNEKDCFMCNNKVPEEGVVVRKESLFSFEAYKLKSFRFLEWETKQLDSGESDVESDN